MARQSNEFALAWASLSGSAIETGWRTIAVAAAGQCALSAGRRFPENQEAVLVGFASINIPAADKLPEGQGFTVERVNLPDESRTWLALTRKDSGSIELFMAMVCDITGMLDVESGAEDTRLLRVFLGRVRAWQEFMRKTTGALGPESELGLVGELMLLGRILELGVAHEVAIGAWIGPLDGIQDFQIGAGAIEVKTTLATVGFPAHIGSLEQLDDSIRQPLFVAGLRLQLMPTGKTLSEIVEDTRDILIFSRDAARTFDERLLRAQYFDGHGDQYRRRFSLVGTSIIEVKGAFPRLTNGCIPNGITKVTYEINLDRVSNDHIELQLVLKQLGAL